MIVRLEQALLRNAEPGDNGSGFDNAGSAAIIRRGVQGRYGPGICKGSTQRKSRPAPSGRAIGKELLSLDWMIGYLLAAAKRRGSAASPTGRTTNPGGSVCGRRVSGDLTALNAWPRSLARNDRWKRGCLGRPLDAWQGDGGGDGSVASGATPAPDGLLGSLQFGYVPACPISCRPGDAERGGRQLLDGNRPAAGQCPALCQTGLICRARAPGRRRRLPMQSHRFDPVRR